VLLPASFFSQGAPRRNSPDAGCLVVRRYHQFPDRRDLRTAGPGQSPNSRPCFHGAVSVRITALNTGSRSRGVPLKTSLLSLHTGVAPTAPTRITGKWNNASGEQGVNDFAAVNHFQWTPLRTHVFQIRIHTQGPALRSQQIRNSHRIVLNDRSIV